MPHSILKETDKYVDVGFESYNGYQGRRREQKFLCVGGPLDGKTAYLTQLSDQHLIYQSYRTRLSSSSSGYQRYNNAGGGGPNCVYVWLEI